MRTIHIVTYDWLEDSLISKTRKPLPEKPYAWDKRIFKKKAALKKDKTDPWHEFTKDAELQENGKKSTNIQAEHSSRRNYIV